MIIGRTRTWLLVAGPVVAVLAAGGCGSSTESALSPSSSTPSRPKPVTSTRPPAPSPSRTSRPKPAAAQVHKRVDARVHKIISTRPSGSISVAALNLASGKRYTAGATSGMWTASAYKLFVVEALLLRGSLSGYAADEAARAIENSDNVAGYSVFLSAGGNAGLSSAASRFGMTHTVAAASDPSFTRTSAKDCLVLLRNLVRTGGPFSADAKSFVLGLMRDVEADQRWGVGVVADNGTTFYNKNGWLSVDADNEPDESDDGLWITTSLGIVTVKGERVLMAVLTQHNSDFDAGVTLVQRLARTIAPAVSRI